MHYWNAADGGFYECQYHGARTLQIIDPDFDWPTSKVPDPDWQGDPEEAPLIEVRDENIEPPIIEVPNPETIIPVDAVEISPTLYQQLLDGLSKGKRIEADADADGRPVLVDQPPETLEQLAARKRLEIDAARDAAFAAGLEYDFGRETDVVQTRPQDQVNLLGLNAKANRLIATGNAAVLMEFRGLSNVSHWITAEAMDDLTMAALSHIESIYQQSWERKDALDAALESNDREYIEGIAW